MINLLNFLIKNGAVFVFLILQSICFWMIVTFNESQRSIFMHNSVLVTSGVQEKITDFYDYWALYRISDSLAVENAKLLKQLQFQWIKSTDMETSSFESIDSIELIPAKIIYNSIGKRNNNILINRGKKHGLHNGMGVIDNLEGIVGITSECSENYCRVLSILHTQSRISAKIKNKGYFGTLTWRTLNPSVLNFEDVPIHADFNIGDTVMTSGYSIVFPEGILAGKIIEKDIPSGSNFYHIKIKLFNDLSKSKYVYVVPGLHRDEKSDLLNPQRDE